MPERFVLKFDSRLQTSLTHPRSLEGTAPVSRSPSGPRSKRPEQNPQLVTAMTFEACTFASMTIFGVHTGLQNTTARPTAIWQKIESLGYEWISIWDHFYAADRTDNPNCLEAVSTLNISAKYDDGWNLPFVSPETFQRNRAICMTIGPWRVAIRMRSGVP